MRVVQIHWAFPPTTGGVESHVADLSAGLAARGCDVTVITGEHSPDGVTGAAVVHTDVLDLDRARARAEGSVDHVDAARIELERLLVELRPDVVHAHNLHHFDPAPALAIDALAQRHGWRVHHTFHETWPDLLHDTPVYRRWAGNYAVSAFVRDECARRIGFTPELRPLGIETARFHSERPALSGATGDVPVILHPARLLPWKGVHLSVRMLAVLAARDVPARLIITDTARIADWHGELRDYRASILRLIEELDLSARIELRAVSYGDMPALYEAADVVVYPTVAAEPFGLVPLEAMSARRPVVAARCGGIPETVVHGVTGLLVPPGDADGLAVAVMGLLADPEQARAMGEAGRARVRAHFDLDRYVDDMLLAYRVASMAK
jgi:glycosyltransferase involved in cell wall biosynthesis